VIPCSEANPDEALAGTAPTRRFWWVIEHPGPWPAEAITESVVGDTTPWALSENERPDTCVLLTRSRRDGDAHRRVWKADAQTGVLEIGSATVDLPTLTAVDGTLTLVCTHGRRDQCCAVRGRPLVDAIPDARECTHIGGHRFAPTILLLPRGIVLGRLSVREWDVARSLGPEALPYYRGRVDLDAPTQIADIEARRAWDLSLTDNVAIVLRRDEGDDRSYRVSWKGNTGLVHVTRSEGAIITASCGAEPRLTPTWTVTRWE